MTQRGRPRKIKIQTDNIDKSEITLEQHKPGMGVQPLQNDGWKDILGGLGSKRDKTTQVSYDTYTYLDDNTLGDIYMGDGLGKRVIDIIADDMTREWVTLEGVYAKEVQEELYRLNAEKICNSALRWKRLYGGSLILIGALGSGKIETPLNNKKITSIDYLKVIPACDVQMGNAVYDEDYNSGNFGRVKEFPVLFRNMITVQNNVKINASRCIEFKNDPLPSTVYNSNLATTRYFGMSSMQAIYEALKDLGSSSQTIMNIMYEFMIGKFKIAGLQDMMAKGQEKKIITRLEIMNMSKSTINAILLGDNEEYTRDFASMAGLPEILDRFMLKLSGATGIPVTRLFGRSPAGLNATGENDLRNYYDLVASEQRNDLYPAIRRLVTVICESRGWEVPDIEFNSLYQMTEQEKTDVDKTKAETENTKAKTIVEYFNIGSIDEQEVRNTIAEDYGLVGEAPDPEENTPEEESELPGKE